MISLEGLIGKEIIAFVPYFHKTTWQKMTLLNVENSGIWVDYRTMSDAILKQSGVTASPKTAVFFLPFHQIVHILESVDVPYLSDEALK
jgi:hypothetical protein